jgi:hypothetical protein
MFWAVRAYSETFTIRPIGGQTDDIIHEELTTARFFLIVGDHDGTLSRYSTPMAKLACRLAYGIYMGDVGLGLVGPGYRGNESDDYRRSQIA